MHMPGSSASAAGPHRPLSWPRSHRRRPSIPGDTMKATGLLPQAPVQSPARLDDYLQLVRPRVALLVLFTVGAGAVLASRGASDLAVIAHVVIGTALVASGASCLNQWLERDGDARMRRTENRPLPAGRLAPAEAL